MMRASGGGGFGSPMGSPMSLHASPEPVGARHPSTEDRKSPLVPTLIMQVRLQPNMMQYMKGQLGLIPEF